MTEPWLDCPQCPECKIECCVLRDEKLLCAACGHKFDGTQEQREQAEKADAAWKERDSQTLKKRPESPI